MYSIQAKTIYYCNIDMTLPFVHADAEYGLKMSYFAT